jgi:putative membrane protein
MRDLSKRLLSEADRKRVEASIRGAERRTSGEIVVLVVGRSDDYPMARLRAAVALAFPAALGLTPAAGALLWLGHENLWVFLGLFGLCFVLFHEVVKHIDALQRLFTPARDMEAEVREAAAAQFFARGLHRTRDATGVLLYVSVFERKVRVLGDRGINAKIPEGFWEGIVALVVEGVRGGRAADALCAAVDRVADLLAEKFPVTAADRDELVNLIVEQ